MTQSGPIRRRLVGGSIQVLLAEALSFPSGILVAAYLTRRLGPSGYGLFALAASLVATIEWFIGSMLSRATIKLTAEADEWRGVAVSILRRHLLIGFGLGAATWAAAGQIGRGSIRPSSPPLVRLAAIQIPIRGVHGGGAEHSRRPAAATGRAPWRARCVGCRASVSRCYWSVSGSELKARWSR